MLLEMVNGGIIEISSDTWSSSGCETCDWGSEYVNQFEIDLTTKRITIEASQMYDFPLTEGFMMKLMISNVDLIKGMTEDGFEEWLREQFKEVVDKDGWGVAYRDFEVDIKVENFEGEI